MTYEEMPIKLPLISKKRLSVFYKLSPWRVRSTRKAALHFRKSSLNSNLCTFMIFITDMLFSLLLISSFMLDGTDAKVLELSDRLVKQTFISFILVLEIIHDTAVSQ